MFTTRHSGFNPTDSTLAPTTPEGQFVPVRVEDDMRLSQDNSGCFQDPCISGRTVCDAIPQDNRDPIIDCRCDSDEVSQNLASPAPAIGPDGYSRFYITWPVLKAVF